PPGWIAQDRTSVGDVPREDSHSSSQGRRWRSSSAGTREERVISKPWSPMRQDIASAESGRSREPVASSVQASDGAASERASTHAAAPSPKRALAIALSSDQPYWKWSEHSSTATRSTRARGSDSAN